MRQDQLSSQQLSGLIEPADRKRSASDLTLHTSAVHCAHPREVPPVTALGGSSCPTQTS